MKILTKFAKSVAIDEIKLFKIAFYLPKKWCERSEKWQILKWYTDNSVDVEKRWKMLLGGIFQRFLENASIQPIC